MNDGRIVSIVDDDESIREALDSLLRSVGFPVETFASGEDFLDSPHLATTACVIVDLRMSGMDGLELQQRLAAGGHRVPVIILTAHGDDEARARALAAGALVFLPKPFDGEVLVAAVESARAMAGAGPLACRR